MVQYKYFIRYRGTATIKASMQRENIVKIFCIIALFVMAVLFCLVFHEKMDRELFPNTCTYTWTRELHPWSKVLEYLTESKGGIYIQYIDLNFAGRMIRSL